MVLFAALLCFDKIVFLLARITVLNIKNIYEQNYYDLKNIYSINFKLVILFSFYNIINLSNFKMKKKKLYFLPLIRINLTFFKKVVKSE